MSRKNDAKGIQKKERKKEKGAHVVSGWQTVMRPTHFNFIITALMVGRGQIMMATRRERRWWRKIVAWRWRRWRPTWSKWRLLGQLRCREVHAEVGEAVVTMVVGRWWWRERSVHKVVVGWRNVTNGRKWANDNEGITEIQSKDGYEKVPQLSWFWRASHFVACLWRREVLSLFIERSWVVWGLNGKWVHWKNHLWPFFLFLSVQTKEGKRADG